MSDNHTTGQLIGEISALRDRVYEVESKTNNLAQVVELTRESNERLRTQLSTLSDTLTGLRISSARTAAVLGFLSAIAGGAVVAVLSTALG